MVADEVLPASKTFLDRGPQSASPSPQIRRLSDEDMALPVVVSAAPMLPKRRAYYISSAERDGRPWEDWGRESEPPGVRPVKKLRRLLWWQTGLSEGEDPLCRRSDSVNFSSARGVGAKVMTYARKPRWWFAAQVN